MIDKEVLKCHFSLYSKTRCKKMFNYVVYGLKKRKKENVITVGLGIVLVILLNLYFGSILSYQKQLKEFAQSIPVYCQITNKSGGLGNGLFISEKIVDNLRQSDMVDDMSCTVIMMAGVGDFKPTEYGKYLNLYVVGANKPEAVGELTYDMINLNQDTITDFFTSDRMECIVSEKEMARRKWKIGDKIPLNLYYYGAESEYMKLELHPMGGITEVEIVGTMEDLLGKTSAIDTDIIMPFEAVRNIYYRYGLTFFADTVTFYVKDPTKLNKFKEEMESIGLVEMTPDAVDSYAGYALAVRDADFIAGATDLMRSIELMKLFFPLIFGLVLLIGYVVSYLFGNSRKDEYALLRLQGVKKTQSSMVFLLEQMILVIVGNLIGDIGMAFVTADVFTIVVVNGVILAAYLVGASIAYERMGKASVMYLLSAQQ